MPDYGFSISSASSIHESKSTFKPAVKRELYNPIHIDSLIKTSNFLQVVESMKREVTVLPGRITDHRNEWCRLYLCSKQH